MRLSSADIEHGYALACQTVVEGDVEIHVPPQEKIERRLTTDRVVAEITARRNTNTLRSKLYVEFMSSSPLPAWMTRLTTGHACRRSSTAAHFEYVTCSLALLQTDGGILREGDWNVTADYRTLRM